MEVNEKFPVLSTVAKILFGLGIVIGIIGLIFGFIELIEYFKLLGTEGGRWYWSSSDIRNIILFPTFLLFGLITMAIAEIIGVLFAIEKNTRK